jgi:hypothetical protein
MITGLRSGHLIHTTYQDIILHSSHNQENIFKESARDKLLHEANVCHGYHYGEMPSLSPCQAASLFTQSSKRNHLSYLMFQTQAERAVAISTNILLALDAITNDCFCSPTYVFLGCSAFMDLALDSSQRSHSIPHQATSPNSLGCSIRG